MMPGSGRFLRSERGRYRVTPPHRAADACFHYSWTQAPEPRPRPGKRVRMRPRCQSAPRVMDSHSRSASPGGRARPQHRPPSPPTPPGVENRAFQPDDPNHNDSFASNHPHQNGHAKEHNGDTKTLEAVNLELINLQPRNGNTKKKEVEVDMNVTNPYDEYFVPVNEHRKYMRGEKLYVTADKRGEKSGCKRPLCWTLLGLVVAAVVALIVLAATGVLFSNSPTPVEQYNASVSSARALGGIGQVPHHNHDHNHNHDHDHDHNHDHAHHYHHDRSKPDEPQQTIEQDETTTHGGYDEFDRPDIESHYDSSMYVPRVMEGELKIDSEELPATLSDPGSNEYRQFTEDFSQALKEALFGKDAARDNGNAVVVEFVQPRKEPGIVMYRIHWKSELNNDPENLLTPNELKADLERYLTRHNRMINVYHIAKDGIKARRVLDLCQINKNNCEYGCEFDENNLDFTCICPENQMLDITNPHRCISTLEPHSGVDDTKEKPNNVVNSDSDKTDSNSFDWKETNSVTLETTTATDPDLKFSHIFGHENNGDDEPNNFSTENKPGLKLEPDPLSELEPEPSFESSPEPSSEPAAEPEPEPSSEPEPVPSSEPEPEPIPPSEREPVPSSEPKPIPSSETVPTSETEPTSKPEPEYVPVSETHLEQERKLLFDPEHDPTPEPEPEPSSGPVAEPTTQPNNDYLSVSEQSSKSEPEPIPESESPVSETTPDTKLVVELESSAEPEPATDVNSTILHSEAEPVVKPSASPEQITKSKLGTESQNEHNTEMDTMHELTTESKLVTNSVNEQEQDNDPELAQVKLVSEAVMDILHYGSNQTQASVQQRDPETVLTTTDLNSEESATESIPETNLQYGSKSESSKEENKTEKESISEPKGTVENNYSDESIHATHVMISPSNDSEELKTNDNDKYVETASNPSFETNPVELILQQNQQGISNYDSDWLDYDKNKTAIENNNKTDNETEQIQLTDLSSSNTTEDELSFDFIAKNNEVPIEVDEEDAKTTPAPVVFMQTNSANITDSNLNKLASDVVDVTSENKNESESQNIHNLDHLETQDKNDHRVESFNIQNTTQTKSIGGELTNEHNENSDISFDFINALYNRSSKSIEGQNRTIIDNGTSNRAIEESTSSNDSDWLPVSVTEISYPKTFSKIPEDTETTTINELEDIINPASNNDDFEPDYLNNMDKTTSKIPEQYVPMYVSHDYNNEEFRVKRVNNDSNDNTNLTTNTPENTNISEPIEATTISEYIYQTTETTTISFDVNQTTTMKDIEKSEPAPVWEDSDSDMRLLSEPSVENSTSQSINQTSEISTNIHSMSDSTTPVNNFNVTIYEISALNNQSFPVTKSINAHSSEYDDHETEMNPFLPEIENNKNLVKKLQEGHDLEPTNLNEKPNENSDDHLIATERQINGKNNSTENTIVSDTTVGRKVTFAMDQNVNSNSGDASGVKNITVANTASYPLKQSQETEKTRNDSQEDVQPISTFLIDTDDLDRERTTATSPIMLKNNLDNVDISPTPAVEKTIASEVTHNDENNNMESLSVVPLHDKDEEQMSKKNAKSDNIPELNDIRTLDLTK